MMQNLAFATVDDGVWDQKYADQYGTLDFGASSAQVHPHQRLLPLEMRHALLHS